MNKKQVEKVVTHEQKEVEKIVKGSRRVGGVLWRYRSHVATRRSHMRQSNKAKLADRTRVELFVETLADSVRNLKN